MASIDKTIEVNVPLRRAYNQWTQFESFPEFMEGVQEVQQIDDTHVRWVVQIAGRTKEWDAEITEQHPDHRVAWRSTSGTQEAGEVTFTPVGPELTQVTVRMEYEPEGAAEKIGDVLGLAERRVQGDLERFKEYVEARPGGDQGWRGRVSGGQPEPRLSGGVVDPYAGGGNPLG